MLLAINIGNTNISFGVFEGIKLLKKFSLPAQSYNIKRLKGFLGKINIHACIICSVAPKSTNILEKDLKSYFDIKPCTLGENITVPIKNNYRNPRQLGQDRLVNAYAGVMLFGAPLIVIDFGTAITVDIVSRRKEYLGGMIIPGLSMSLEALSQKTALLPEIKLDKPKEFIGRDTKNGMLSGIIYGFAALTDGLIDKIRKEIGKNAKVIGTGGNVNLINNYCFKIDKIEEDLTIKGLQLIYNNSVV